MLCEMPYDDPVDIEALVRAGGECPVLSQGLRERIVAQAIPARAAVVRRQRRGRAGVALALSLALALFVGRQPLLSSARLEALLVPLTVENLDDILDRDTTVIASVPPSEADDVDWNQVETMALVRRWQIDTLRSAFAA